jgi:hypothetical protein
VNEIPLPRIAKARDIPHARDLTPRTHSKASQSWTASAFRHNAVLDRERISTQRSLGPRADFKAVGKFWEVAPRLLSRTVN